MKHKLTSILTLALVLLITIPAGAGADAKDKSAAKKLFTAEAYIEHVKYLASDELTGRRPATEGARLAAEYIIKQFQAAGLQPGGPDGGWLQPFDVRRGKRLIDEQALLEISGLDRKWKVREDWIPFPFTLMEDVEGPLAFVGYGIQAAQYDYDDYGDFDAEGKILLILRYEPKADDPEAKFGGKTPSRYALFVRKARTAHKHGAKALLIVNPPNRDPDQDELFRFREDMRQTHQLPMAHISRELANALLKKAGAPDLKTLQEKLDQERQSLARDLGLTVKLHPGVETNKLTASNVIGLLPGDGSTAETIVIGAHRDHLGKVARRRRGDDSTPAIHNGADDNASGTAAVLELARVLAAGPTPRRNVLFIAFDAEEMGLVGSRHFVQNPTTDLENIRAMVNFDMIGRLKNDKYTVFGTNTAEEFPKLVENAAAELELEYRAAGTVSGGSDHAPFVRREIPAMFVFTGVHKQYHQPDDDWELIDAEGAAKILQMWYPIIVDLANMDAGPTWTEPPEPGEEETIEVPRPAIEEEAERDRAAAEGESQEESDEPPSRGGLRVRLGIVPDMVGDDEPGMLVESVVAGGPAKAAGIQDGDRIIKIGDEDIRDIYGYMRALQDFKPGDEVDVIVERQGVHKTLKVKLQASQRRRPEN